MYFLVFSHSVCTGSSRNFPLPSLDHHTSLCIVDKVEAA